MLLICGLTSELMAGASESVVKPRELKNGKETNSGKEVQLSTLDI